MEIKEQLYRYTTAPFRKFMFREHIRNLQQEIDTYQKSIDEAGGKGGQKRWTEDS